jgi:Ni2+-binding GTPase involved in maturation of urease and hydrogenase
MTQRARLARSHAPVRQILTGTACHLDATMLEKGLDGWDTALRNIQAVRSGMEVLRVSSKTGEGI